MLTFGGIGLLGAGLFFMLGGDRLIKDPANAAKAKKQAPILVVIGAVLLGLAVFVGF